MSARSACTVGSVARRVVREDRGQPDCLGAEVVSGRVRPPARRCILVEQEIEHIKHRAEAGREVSGVRHGVGDMLGADRPFRPHEPLGNCWFLWREESARDLRDNRSRRASSA